MKIREDFQIESCLECEGYGTDFWDEFFCLKGKCPDNCPHLKHNNYVQHKDSDNSKS